ncbi:uncharacterized protein YeaO (DUF488 family) [Polaromonas sp. CG_9.5]|uniref:DUF488 domain-containing protein n=1 Tax=Polaromonas sp. CG_9.5 TaxID=3071705 RepID=UPI002E053774|nr:uncharacterized protein YeaO (DUF488 family) [Polaromonas sp. CG_9.5]
MSKTHLAVTAMGAEDRAQTELRQWLGHDPARWGEFRRRYRDELRREPELVGQLRSLARSGPLTLVYSAHDQAHNDAVVLYDVLLGR